MRYLSLLICSIVFAVALVLAPIPTQAQGDCTCGPNCAWKLQCTCVAKCQVATVRTIKVAYFTPLLLQAPVITELCPPVMRQVAKQVQRVRVVRPTVTKSRTSYTAGTCSNCGVTKQHVRTRTIH